MRIAIGFSFSLLKGETYVEGTTVTDVGVESVGPAAIGRAEMILLAADGWTNQAVAAGVTRATVDKWRRRFPEDELPDSNIRSPSSPSLQRKSSGTDHSGDQVLDIGSIEVGALNLVRPAVGPVYLASGQIQGYPPGFP